MVTNHYRAYNLTITSDIPLPELPSVDSRGRPDVTIAIGTAATELPDPLTRSTFHEANAHELLLRVPGVGRFQVRDGESIVVSPDTGVAGHDVRVYLLGSCFGAVLHQRGALVLHASGIGTATGAILFTGDSGAGKSTLLGEMLNRGFDMIVDDVCAIFPTAIRDGLVVPPSYPRSRLWSDAAESLGIDTSALPRTRSDMDKYERQVPSQFWDSATPPRRIYVLGGEHDGDVTLTRLPAMAALPVLVANTYRQVLLDGFGIRQRHFDIASRVAQSVPLVHVVRPRGVFSVADIADAILADLDEGSAPHH